MTQPGDRLTPSQGQAGEAHARRPPRSRWWWALAAALAVGFLVILVVTTEQAAVPVGGSAATPGMAMPSSSATRIELTMRDVADRALRIPDGRPGVAVFVQASGCPNCVQAVRTAARALAQTRPSATLLVIAVDSSTSRSALAAFARSAGEPSARYAVDDRNSTLANVFGASMLGEAVVFGAGGQVVERVGTPRLSGLAQAMGRA